ncbi:hypothetical protein BGZ89_008390, partial [Linnemannia elongata]
RRDRDRDRDPRYTTDKYDNNSSRDPYYPPESPSENLFPASRYAAPFVRDYELQQRERDARPGLGAYEDDGPYEEAILWTRSPPIAVPAPTLRD